MRLRYSSHRQCRPSRADVCAVCALLLLSGCSGVFSSPSEYEQAKQQEQSFADTIAAAGGTAKKEGRAKKGFQAAGWLIDLNGAQVTDELVDDIIEARKKEPIFQLDLSKSTITDDQLAKLDAGKVLQQCFVLDLSETAVTDSGLDQLKNVHCLEQLRLKGSQATAAGAKRLGQRKVSHPETPKPFKTPPKVEI